MIEILVALSLALSAARPDRVQPVPEFVVVVNASNPVDAMAADRLSKIFLRKVQRWESGAPIVAVDQLKDAAVRVRFSSLVHRRPLEAVVAYWQQQIFSGHAMPPSERSGDEAVLAFVRGNAGAIGYVTANAALPPGVKTLSVGGDGVHR